MSKTKKINFIDGYSSNVEPSENLATGPVGPIGLTGATGPQGDASTAVGPVGPQGPKGDKGDQGPAADLSTISPYFLEALTGTQFNSTAPGVEFAQYESIPAEQLYNTITEGTFSPNGKYFVATKATSPYFSWYRYDQITNTFTDITGTLTWNGLPVIGSYTSKPVWKPNGLSVQIGEIISTINYIKESDWTQSSVAYKILAWSMNFQSRDTGVNSSAELNGLTPNAWTTMTKTCAAFYKEELVAVAGTSISGGTSLQLYSISGANATRLTIPTITDTIKSVKFSANGQYMAVVFNGSPGIKVFKIVKTYPAGVLTYTITAVTFSPAFTYTTINDCSFSPNGNYFAVAKNSSEGGNSFAQFLVDSTLDTFTLLNNPSTVITGVATIVSYSPNGKYLSAKTGIYKANLEPKLKKLIG